ncbi:hypothetical protein HWV62_16834 [Athelia sp. TMB]|nr:hypothetical protein HWV62_16834 [Athelia sp. TMB]
MSDQQSSGGISDNNLNDSYGQGQGQQQSGGQGGYGGQQQIQGQGLDEQQTAQQFGGGVSGGEQDGESASLESDAQAFVRKFGLAYGSDL